MTNIFNKSNNDHENNRDELVIMDAQLLVLKEKAESGNADALADLAHAFRTGEGAGKNYSLAKKYNELLLNSLDGENVLGKYYVLWNLAVLEADYGNYENLKKRFYQIIDFMVNNIPMEEWNFDVFDWIKECVDWKNNEQ